MADLPDLPFGVVGGGNADFPDSALDPNPVTMAAPVVTTPSVAATTQAPAQTQVTPVVPTTTAPVVQSRTTTAAPVANTPNPATPQSSAAASTTPAAAIPSTAQTSSIASTIISTSAAATSATPSTTPATSTIPTSTIKPSTSTSSSALKSTTTSTSTRIASTLTVSNTSASHSATSAAASSGSKGIGGSGLSLGALIGIIAGGVVALILIAVLATRTIRKKNRARRTANRSSMFDWPATGLEEEPFEKPRYEPPSQSFAMSDPYNNSGPAASVPYMTNDPVYADVPASHVPQSYMARNNPQTSYSSGGYQNLPPSEYNSYPPAQYPPQQPQGQYPQYQANIVPPPEEAPMMGAGAGGPVGPSGLRDGSMVRVKVGFVRSLEDELAIIPGQQLYLHTAYDDGWSLCEDQSHNRGVVPVSCLEPWQDNLAPMTRENSGQESLSERSERRSSLYRPDGQGGY
ncbi:hypothetical protein CI109_106374 [Kwoniella shandongensis]|uniref:Uncharacterized protein n=1 Tax=Kwoniella shandongensis TaxID=1734106 RepID=A0A5M6BSE0_9TREE|nr:uncharacterized protein CI109_005919 [Kwoniella shandongensis]KAA5525756.1 hypothetical protein CI109_005919 [Kwoniella shandongensis]